MNSIPPMFITLALMATLLLAEVGGGGYLVIAPRVAPRARRAGVGLVLVAAAQIAHAIATFAITDAANSRPPSVAAVFGPAAAIGFAEAAALALLFTAILGPGRPAAGGDE